MLLLIYIFLNSVITIAIKIATKTILYIEQLYKNKIVHECIDEIVSLRFILNRDKGCLHTKLR